MEYAINIKETLSRTIIVEADDLLPLRMRKLKKEAA